jgi:hypothetical protein
VSRVARGAGDQSPGCATSWTEYSRADWAEREVGPEPRSRARGWELREKRAASGVGGGRGTRDFVSDASGKARGRGRSRQSES